MIIADHHLRLEEVQAAPVVPLPATPFWDQPWIDPQLNARAFGPLGTGPSRTYMIIDAALRTKITGVFDLDAQQVPVECLFEGDAAADYADTAPYLVDLTLPETGPTQFHRTLFAEQWAAGTGIVLRSAADMATVRAHFRHFTRTKGANGRWMLFRFWETTTLRDYFELVATALPGRANDLFRMRNGTWIDALIGHAQALNRTYVVQPNRDRLEGAPRSAGVFSLSPQEEQALYRGILRKHAKAIERSLTEAEAGTAQDLRDREELVFRSVLRMRGAGILQLAHLERLAAWDLAAKGPFEAGHPELAAVLSTPMPEKEKLARLTEMRGAPAR